MITLNGIHCCPIKSIFNSKEQSVELEEPLGCTRNLGWKLRSWAPVSNNRSQITAPMRQQYYKMSNIITEELFERPTFIWIWNIFYLLLSLRPNLLIRCKISVKNRKKQCRKKWFSLNSLSFVPRLLAKEKQILTLLQCQPWKPPSSSSLLEWITKKTGLNNEM